MVESPSPSFTHLMFAILILSQMPKTVIFAILVAMVMFIPGLKEKVTNYINNGILRVSRVSNQVSSSGDAKDSPAA
jgi:hypothetical protein